MRLLALIGALGIVVAIAAAVYFFGGFYNVAAQDDPAPVAWALIKVRMASVDRHATVNPPAGYDTPEKIQAGAKTFLAAGCTNCHGGPGVDWAKFSEGLHPGPPDLKEVVPNREPRHLFWVVKNGINMTGMPSFADAIKDEDIWPLVAFLKKLPSVSDADFKTWTGK